MFVKRASSVGENFVDFEKKKRRISKNNENGMHFM
jgi:hypothetical protein